MDEGVKNRLDRLAKQTGLSRSAVVRKLIMGADVKSRPPDEWPELVRQVSAIGNNINQLVRIANSEKTVPAETVLEVQRLLAAVWEKVKNI